MARVSQFPVFLHETYEISKKKRKRLLCIDAIVNPGVRKGTKSISYKKTVIQGYKSRPNWIIVWNQSFFFTLKKLDFKELSVVGHFEISFATIKRQLVTYRKLKKIKVARPVYKPHLRLCKTAKLLGNGHLFFHVHRFC